MIMVPYMMDNGSMIKLVIKDKSSILIKTNMKVIFSMERNMEKEFIIIVQEEDIKENGFMTKNMVMD